MRFVIIVALFLVTLLSGYDIRVNKGWQLVGFPTAQDDLSFLDKHIELAWGYDTNTTSWRAYSPQVSIAQLIEENPDVKNLSHVRAWQGIWIKGVRDDYLSLGENRSDTNSSNSGVIELEVGWNLISLPIFTTVSAKLFDGLIVWKYNNGWELFTGDANESYATFPKIDSIDSDDGFWVYAAEKRTIDISKAASKLVNFDTQLQMNRYIKSMIHYYDRRQYYYGYPMALEIVDAPMAEPAVDTKITDATETNLQEEGVDESDIVKSDGQKYIYYLNRYDHQVYITTFDNVILNNTTPVATLDTNASYNIDSIYLQNGKLILVYNPSYSYQVLWSDTTNIDYWNRPSLIEIYDVTDIGNITKTDTIAIDGRIVTTRLIDNKLYTVSRFQPHVEYTYPKVYIDVNGTCYNEMAVSADALSLSIDTCLWYYQKDEQGYFIYDYDKPIEKNIYLAPYIALNGGEKGALIEPNSLYAPLKLDQSASIVTVSAFDLNNTSYHNSLSYIGETFTQYASKDAFYLVSNEYPIYRNFWEYQEQSAIYKISLDGNLSYKGNGFIDGRVLNQFSLSDYNATLRVAATEGFSWRADGTKNSIFTMQEQNSSLNVIGRLDGLGKEDETIRAVRFNADKGYVVTYKQTDPFYTLDLSNPYQPLKVGELHIDGFSEYFHIVDANRVLSIGRDSDASGTRLGLQVELFDVSDFTNPKLADKVTIGGRSTYSEAEYNHHAFTFRGSDEKFAFPVTHYDTYTHNSLNLFALDGLSITPLGFLNAPDIANKYYYGQSRSVIFNANSEEYVVYFVNGKFISSKVSDLDNNSTLLVPQTPPSPPTGI